MNIILGIAGRGGESALCVLTKTNDTFRRRSSIDGNGAKCAKYFLAYFSSVGKYDIRRILQSKTLTTVLNHRSYSDILSEYANL